MRVLLDENMDRLLKDLFDDEFEVMTVRECGWKGKTNGVLLGVAEQEFDVLVTMDKNIEHQQNLSVLNLGIIVVRAWSNAYVAVAPLMPKVHAALRIVQPGQVIHVTA